MEWCTLPLTACCTVSEPFNHFHFSDYAVFSLSSWFGVVARAWQNTRWINRSGRGIYLWFVLVMCSRVNSIYSHLLVFVSHSSLDVGNIPSINRFYREKISLFIRSLSLIRGHFLGIHFFFSKPIFFKYQAVFTHIDSDSETHRQSRASKRS